jgi:hypothetical protein
MSKGQAQPVTETRYELSHPEGTLYTPSLAVATKAALCSRKAHPAGKLSLVEIVEHRRLVPLAPVKAARTKPVLSLGRTETMTAKAPAKTKPTRRRAKPALSLEPALVVHIDKPGVVCLCPACLEQPTPAEFFAALKGLSDQDQMAKVLRRRTLEMNKYNTLACPLVLSAEYMDWFLRIRQTTAYAAYEDAQGGY